MNFYCHHREPKETKDSIHSSMRTKVARILHTSARFSISLSDPGNIIALTVFIETFGRVFKSRKYQEIGIVGIIIEKA